jgi:hypothetical protein
VMSATNTVVSLPVRGLVTLYVRKKEHYSVRGGHQIARELKSIHTTDQRTRLP